MIYSCMGKILMNQAFLNQHFWIKKIWCYLQTVFEFIYNFAYYSCYYIIHKTITDWANKMVLITTIYTLICCVGTGDQLSAMNRYKASKIGNLNLHELWISTVGRLTFNYFFIAMQGQPFLHNVCSYAKIWCDSSNCQIFFTF